MSDAQQPGGPPSVGISAHASDRWHQRRKTAPGCGPLVAWEQAEELPRAPTIDADEARYHEPTDLVFIANESWGNHDLVIVTAIRVATAHPKLQAAIEEVTAGE